MMAIRAVQMVRAKPWEISIPLEAHSSTMMSAAAFSWVASTPT